MNYVRIVVVWKITIIIEKFTIANNPWNLDNDIFWLSFARHFKGSG
jgi:hypothetical protein